MRSRSYYVVMIDYPRRWLPGGTFRPAEEEAIVNPDITRADIVSRIRSGEYDRITFIHEHQFWPDGAFISRDVTDELIDEANHDAEAA